jgi:hypothetical protein
MPGNTIAFFPLQPAEDIGVLVKEHQKKLKPCAGMGTNVIDANAIIT